ERLRDAELFVIAAAASRPEQTAELLAEVDTDDFAFEEHQDFWRRLGALFVEQGRVSLEMVSTAKGALTSVAQAARTFTSTVQSPACPDPLDTFRSARAVSKIHRMLSDGRETLSALDAAPGTVRDFVDGLAHGARELAAEASPRVEPRTAASLAFESLSTAEASWSATYGIRALDRATAGLRPGTFHVLIASTGHGKSSLAATAALRSAERGLRVLYVTKEMSAEECSERWASMVTGRTPSQLRELVATGVIQPGDLDGRIPEGLCPRADLRTPIAIAAEVHRAEIEGAPYGLVVVDYLQQYPGPGDSTTERIDSAVDLLKSMALERGVAVLAPAQLNRENDDAGIPHRFNIRGSGSVEQWADVVVAIRKTSTFYTASGDFE
ncbi:MAG: DnaB-like helicase C-terminal domain-containing protein, partial [Planctomycetota bacterium]